MKLSTLLLPCLIGLTLPGLTHAQVLADWDFGGLVNPGVPNLPLTNPLLTSNQCSFPSDVLCSPLTGASDQAGFQGLLWAQTNAAPGELNLKFWDGDLSNLGGTANDGVNDNYLAFTLIANGSPIEAGRISISVWRNGSGAPNTFAFEVVVDGGTPQAFGSNQIDPAHGDFGYDWFHFDGNAVANSTLEIRFRPIAGSGGLGTGNLHINGIRVSEPASGPGTQSGPNVLFLIADDLTAEALACYGNSQVLTPNIDALAARGLKFQRAYAQYPVCAHSRASLMTGMYTARLTGAGGNYAGLDSVLGDHATMPEHFRINGYCSARVSKIYHMRVPGDITNGVAGPDHAPSWDFAHNVQAPEWMTAGLAAHYTNENLSFDPNAHYGLGFGAAFYTVEASTTGAEQADVLSVDRAIQLMEQLQDDPFFLAVGFVRPHVPLVAPVAHYAPYVAQNIQLAQAVAGDLNDIPSAGIFWNEPVRGPFTDDARRHVRRAYYASVSFMDEQVGRILTRLDELDLSDDTIVVFTSDHGYHLGEHTMWQKLSLHEESARVPLIVAGEGVAVGTTEALTELSDLYPTLAEYAGLPIPPACQGHSLMPVLADPAEVVREAVYSTASGDHLLRTNSWAYMRYGPGVEELYDMANDQRQFTNLASEPAHASTLQAMRDSLDGKLSAVASDAGFGSCYGDSPSAHCPCSSYGQAGEGCKNSTGHGASLQGGGSADLTSDSFTLTVEGGPPNQVGYLLYGSAAPPQRFGAGILCTQPLARLAPKRINNFGRIEFRNLAPSTFAGIPLRYQFVYRDVGGACDSFNISNAWVVTWN